MTVDLDVVIEEAMLAASTAARQKLAENPGQWWPCGFSWVRIKPARGELVRELIKRGIGHTSSEGGFRVYNPSGNATQWMDAKRAGSDAFVAVIKKYYPNLNVYAEELMD